MSIEEELQKLADWLIENNIAKVRILEPKFSSVRVHYEVESDEFGGEWTPPFDLPRINDKLRRVRDDASFIKYHNPLLDRVNEMLS